MARVYLDHHAATPLDPRVRAELAQLDEQAWANPSSVHAEGRGSRALLERARELIAQAISATAADVVLTSGGTEACNLAVRGVLEGRPGKSHVVTTQLEHPAVAEPLAELERLGCIEVTRLSVPAGRPPEPAELARYLRADTALCAVQLVNHELGTIFPVQGYADVCRAAGVPCFVDATQGFGKIEVSVEDLGVDLVALASHKIGGPAGAGALWTRRAIAVSPLILGGGQERGRRAGTPDVRAAFGFGVASSLVPERLAAMPRLAALRDRLEVALLELGAVRNAPDGLRAATVTNVWWPGRRSDVLVGALDIEGVAVSAGAACSSGKSEPSAVVLAAHPEEPARAKASTRFSFGPDVTDDAVEIAIQACRVVVSRAGVMAKLESA